MRTQSRRPASRGRPSQHRRRRVGAADSEAGRLNEELTSFAYAASHDLRGPLRRILLFNDALLKDHSGQLDAKGREYLARIRTAGEHMHRLIESIAALARITQHRFQRKRVDLSAVARGLAAELADSAPGRDARFRVQPGLSAQGDPELLSIALRRLLENAWKFTSGHPRARIEFGARVKGAETQFFVRDDGAGFDMSFARKLFHPFERLHRPDEFPGTGIGLAVVERVIRRHRGRLWAEGRVEGGAAFYFTLGGEAP